MAEPTETPVPELQYAIACVGCGITMHLQMIAHRDTDGQIVGWLFSCEECQPDIIGRQVIFVKEGNGVMARIVYGFVPFPDVVKSKW